MAKDKEYIFPLTPRCSSDELREKLNEVIEYLNGCISVGLLPLPDEDKEDEK